jgi:hypothetical protein
MLICFANTPKYIKKCIKNDIILLSLGVVILHKIYEFYDLIIS